MQQVSIQIQEEVNALRELFFSITEGAVSKIGENSVEEGFLYCIAKVGQKINKDVLNLRADINPDLAFGSQLDDYATRNGFPNRFNATGSATNLFINAAVGTVYLANTNKFTANNGEVFVLQNDVTIGSLGFAYPLVASQNTGSNTKVEPNTILKVDPVPTGHIFCTNDFTANGGSDNESDIDFRNRLKQSLNILATGTLAQYEQAFMKINNRVLRLFKGGFDAVTGKLILYVASIDGINFSDAEFDAILVNSDKFLSITEQIKGLILRNMNYLNIDVSMRLELQAGVDIHKVRVLMQRAFQRKYDYRYLNAGDVVSRLQLMLIATKTNYVKRILDNYFYPLTDITIPDFTFVRFRSFVFYDINGNVISDNENSINSQYQMFFANNPDYIFQQSLLTNI